LFDITFADAIGHLSYILILTGTLFIHNKNRIGWIFRLLGDIGWVWIGWNISFTSAMIWSSVFAVLEIRGFYMWSKDSTGEEKKKPVKPYNFKRVRM